MHYFDKENHMYGGHAIVAGHLPLATGMAFASRYRGRIVLRFAFSAMVPSIRESSTKRATWQHCGSCR